MDGAIDVVCANAGDGVTSEYGCGRDQQECAEAATHAELLRGRRRTHRPARRAGRRRAALHGRGSRWCGFVGKLAKDLVELVGRAAFGAAAAEAHEPVDLRGVGDFGERLRAACVTEISTSLLPTRTSSANCRAASGTRPSTLTTSSGSIEFVFLAPRRTNAANNRNSPSTTASAAPVLYNDSKGTPNEGSNLGSASARGVLCRAGQTSLARRCEAARIFRGRGGDLKNRCRSFEPRRCNGLNWRRRWFFRSARPGAGRRPIAPGRARRAGRPVPRFPRPARASPRVLRNRPARGVGAGNEGRTSCECFRSNLVDEISGVGARRDGKGAGRGEAYRKTSRERPEQHAFRGRWLAVIDSDASSATTR